MKTLPVLMVCLTALAVSAQRPHPCRSPPLLTGDLTVSTQSERLWAYAKFMYDALGQKVRMWEMGTYDNKNFTVDTLLLFREGVMYVINWQKQSCTKEALKTRFHPLAVPKDASLLGQAVLGSSSGPGQGLLVNTWQGDVHMKNQTLPYMFTVTEFGCIPVSSVVRTDELGWTLTSFFNNVIGITDPQALNPPSFCDGVEMQNNPGDEPVDFYSLFRKHH